MKQYLLLLGGFLGFTSVFTTGLVIGQDITQILFNSSIGCVIGGMMFKWLGLVIMECVVARRKAQAKIAATAIKEGV